MFQEMENMRPCKILRGRVLSYAAASLGSCKMILQNNWEPCFDLFSVLFSDILRSEL